MKEKVIQFLEENKNNTLIVTIDSSLFYFTKSIENVVYRPSKVSENAYTLHTGEDEYYHCTFTLNHIDDITESKYTLDIHYSDGSILVFELI